MKRSEKKSRGVYSYILKNLTGFVLMSIALVILFYLIMNYVMNSMLNDLMDDLGIVDQTVSIGSTDSEAAKDNNSRMVIDKETVEAVWEEYDQNTSILIMTGVLTIFILIAVIMVFSARRMKRRIVKPLGRLNEEMEQLSLSEIPETEMPVSGLLEFDEIMKSFERMSERLRTSENERRSLEESRAKMLADISHDLKTPITVIQGYSKAVLDNIADEETKRRYLTAIYNKSLLISELINSFHEYSKLDHPQFELSFERNDICEYLREYLAMRYEELELAGCELETEIPESVIVISFDRTQLKRVFENIINNSLRHNTGRMTIFAELVVDGGTVVIHLGDDGAGIPEAIREHIFEPFVTGNEARTSGGGSGLGMAISKKIAEAHGGELLLLSDEHRGTVYELRLPAAE